MYLSSTQTLIMIFCIAAGTMITRFLPFALFPENKEVPSFVTYLGEALPSAMMGLLVVYCLKNVSFISSPFGIPEALAILFIIIIHKYKNNTLLSIGGGTLVYMFLIQTIFI